MKRYTSFILLSVIVIMIGSFTKPFNKDVWQMLFNGKDFSGWDTYIAPPFDDEGNKLSDVPVGLNNDPRHVFSIVNDNGENVIRISGENWGGISTKKEYDNFHLQLMFKWGALSWGQKKARRKTAAYSTLRLASMALMPGHGCVHRNSR